MFGAATQPLPLFFSTVTVKVCAAPRTFVPAVAMLIRAFTKVFVAGPDPPGPLFPLVLRTSGVLSP